MSLLAALVLGIRFLLEVVTVLGLASGIFLEKRWVQKLVFFLVALGITLVWAKYGAPKSPASLTGFPKLMLELIVYGIGIVGMCRLFGLRIGGIYAIFVIGDLVLMYVLQLQGH